VQVGELDAPLNNHVWSWAASGCNPQTTCFNPHPRSRTGVTVRAQVPDIHVFLARFARTSHELDVYHAISKHFQEKIEQNQPLTLSANL
jgi:hypothetical protein